MTIFEKFYRAVFRLRHHRLFDDVIGEEKYFSLQIPTNYTQSKAFKELIQNQNTTMG